MNNIQLEWYDRMNAKELIENVQNNKDILKYKGNKIYILINGVNYGGLNHGEILIHDGDVVTLLPMLGAG